jgi:hypothetical protein
LVGSDESLPFPPGSPPGRSAFSADPCFPYFEHEVVELVAELDFDPKSGLVTLLLLLLLVSLETFFRRLLLLLLLLPFTFLELCKDIFKMKKYLS